jgi:hypothetical protein
VNRIKPAYNQELWRPKTERKPERKLPQKQAPLALQQMVEEEETSQTRALPALGRDPNGRGI